MGVKINHPSAWTCIRLYVALTSPTTRPNFDLVVTFFLFPLLGKVEIFYISTEKEDRDDLKYKEPLHNIVLKIQQKQEKII